MRIAMLVRRFDPAGGGTERDFAAAAQSLAEGGHEVRIFAARTAASSWRGMPVRRVPVPLAPRSLEILGFGLLASRYARLAGAGLTISFGRVADCDLIRCEGGSHAAYLEAARQWESRRVCIARSLSPYHAAQCRLERMGFRASRLKLVLAISGMVGEDLKHRFNLPSARVATLYNGVEHQRFYGSGQRRESMRRALGLEAEDRVVLFVGSGFRRKGLGQLIEAMPMCAGDVRLLVAGEDRAAAFFRQIALRLRLHQRVIFLGKRNDVADLMAAADVVALPSLFEAFGNVVLEAMAAGKPVLTSARCGAAEVLPEQLRGFVVRNPMDPAEIARRLDELLRAGPRLGEIARAAAAAYTWQAYGARLLKLIETRAQPGPA